MMYAIDASAAVIKLYRITDVRTHARELAAHHQGVVGPNGDRDSLRWIAAQD